MRNDCLSCVHYLVCDDENKGPTFSCHLFSLEREERVVDVDDEPDAEVDLEKELDDQGMTYEEKVRDILLSELRVPIDVSVDDSSVPRKPNFYRFATDSDGLGIEPYPVQVQIITRLYSEYCPYCSDTEWFVNGLIPVNTPFSELENRVSFLENGICPSCGGKKAEFINSGEMNGYTELAAAIGQRGGKCVEYNSLVLTAQGLRKIGWMSPDGVTEPGFHDYSAELVNVDGSSLHASKFYIEKPEYLRTVELTDGSWLTGTNNHPIQIAGKGWVSLLDLEQGDVVRIKYGQDVWATTTPSLDTYVTHAHQRFTAWLAEVPTTHRHQVKHPDQKMYRGTIDSDIAKLLGYWVSEGRGGHMSITNYDTNILDGVERTLERLVGPTHVLRRPNVVEIRTQYAYFVFDELLGGLDRKSKDKEVPRVIFESPRCLVIDFLRALFEGDGCVENACVTYTSLSYDLVLQVRTLLLNLGIISRIGSHKTWATNGSPAQVAKDCWGLAISGVEQLTAFQSIVGFASSRKQQSLSIVVNKQRTKNVPHWYHKLPGEVKARLLEFISAFKIASKQFKHPTNPCCKLGMNTFIDSYHSFWRIMSDNVSLSQARLRTFVDLMGPAERYITQMGDWFESEWAILKRIAYEEKTFYAAVRRTYQSTEKQASYDFTVDDKHLFIANGMVNHNSAVVAMAGAYHTHWTLKLQRPTMVYGLLPSSSLEGVFVAISFAQAVSTVWTPYLNYLTDSPWFSKYNRLLDKIGQATGKELYRIKETFCVYKHRHLEVKPASPSTKTLRGTSRIFCLDGDTLVSTNLGLVPIKKIDPKVHTESHVGRVPRKIKHAFLSGNAPTVEITLETGQSLICTGNHGILAIHSQDINEARANVSWVNAEDLRPGKDHVVISLKGYSHVRQAAGVLASVNAHQAREVATHALAPLKHSKHSCRVGSLFTSYVWLDLSGEDCLSSDVAVVPIRSIEMRPACDVYDLSIETEGNEHLLSHGFTANSFIVHNTSLDEIGWLDSDINTSSAKVKFNAKGVHGALNRSLLTIRSATTRLIKQGFSDIPTGMAFNISSISDARDMICFLVNQSRNSKVILGIKAATWEINPSVPRDDPEIVEAFRLDPVAANRDYGSVAPLSDRPFITNFSRLENCFVGEQNGLVYRVKRHRLLDGSETLYLELVSVIKTGFPSVLSLDAGHVFNSFAFTLGHVNSDGFPVADVMAECQPLPQVVVDHSLILEHFVKPLIEACKVTLVVSDRWQNIKFLQDITHAYPHVTCKTYSVRYSDFVTIRQHMWDEEFILPTLTFDPDAVSELDPSEYPQIYRDVPMEHFVLQLRTVRDFGNAVTKGTGLTDDLFRSFILLGSYLTDQDTYDTFLTGGAPEEEKPKPTFIAISTKMGGPRRSSDRTIASEGRFLGALKGRR